MTHPSIPARDLAEPDGANDFPEICEPLEEVAAAQPGDAATALGFCLGRLAWVGRQDRRPLVLVTSAEWARERGRPFAGGLAAWGLEPERLI
ncbi:MAG: hypothetical protein P4L64_05560, partial [Caulobacteraceae bacterium]|nr:hypothetical protein [Caulobacteraceae bacterium]